MNQIEDEVRELSIKLVELMWVGWGFKFRVSFIQDILFVDRTLAQGLSYARTLVRGYPDLIQSFFEFSVAAMESQKESNDEQS